MAAQLLAFRQRCDGKAEPELLERLDCLQMRLDRLSGVEILPSVPTDDLFLVTCHPVEPATISDLEFSATEQLETEVFYLKVESLKKRTRPTLTESDIKQCIQLSTLDAEETIVRETQGKVRIVTPLDTVRKYVSYHLHLRGDDGWKIFHGDLKNGMVEAMIPTPDKALVCITSRGTEYDVKVGPSGTEYRFTSNKDVLIRFPKGAVQSNQVIHVSLESADRSVIQQMKRNQPELSIVGFTDIVHIEHDEPFRKDVCVELPMEMITADDITACDLIAVHFDDDNIIIDQKGNKMKKVGKNKIKLETSLFSGKGIFAKRKRHKRERQKSDSESVCSIYGYNVPCSILVFLGEGPTIDSWMVWGEVVPEHLVGDIAKRRTTENGLREPPNCRSDGKCFKKKTRIHVYLGSKGCLKMCNGVMEKQCIVYQPKAIHNYVSFPVVKTDTSEMAILNFKTRAKKKQKDLHTAYFRPTAVLPVASGISEENEPKGFFDSRSMLTLVQHIDINDLLGLATGLGISMTKYQDLRFVHEHRPDEFKLSVINKWLKSSSKGPEKDILQLTNVLEECDINSVAEVCKSVFKKGRGLTKKDFR
ncbi:uncharacterized protein LOC117333613 isoform X2 [Pecten maximus]|uniref:uncharacterized protein LOC117333613 isoform X2 n=1 Tax=Pecten maximus TaxID=6579 RepID=UPI001458D86B|nr:uncharacterized protein LOC117333613 isoform X2 [Pecten maximus]